MKFSRLSFIPSIRACKESNLFNLNDKVAIVTGCGSETGIGFSIANILAKAGASVMITSTTDRIFDRVQELEHSYGKTRVKGFRADLTDENQVKELVATAKNTFSRIDILVNNAGMVQTGCDQPSRKFSELTLENWNFGIDISLKSTFLVSLTVLPELRQQKYGRIVNVSSVTGTLVGINGSTVYSAAKAAMLGLTRSLAIEEGENNLTINCVGPGWIQTGSSSQEEIQAGLYTPVGRPGKPEEVGHTVLFLASEEASYITGQMIVVDGGNTIQEYKVEFDGSS